MSIYCGASFGGGKGYTDVCGKEVYGKGTPLAQCAGCMKTEIGHLKAESESLCDQLEDADEQVVALEKQVKALMREYEPMRKDAERYRWLRAGSTGHHLISMHLFETISDDCNPPYRAMKYGRTLDEAIDAISSPEKP